MFNPLKWLRWLWVPIAKNGTFFVFMFALGWLCCHLEIMPYYLRNRGAQAYEFTIPELFLDLYIVCVILTLIRALTSRLSSVISHLLLLTTYLFLYGVAIVDVFCYVRFESTLTPTMLMLVTETSRQEALEFFYGYMNFAIITTNVGWILLLVLIHILWTFVRRWLNTIR